MTLTSDDPPVSVCRTDTSVIPDMAATSNFQSPPQILLPKTALGSYSSQTSIENFLPAKYGVIEWSDNMFLRIF